MSKSIFQNMKSKDILASLNSIIKKMTIDEKLAQLGSIWSYQVIDENDFSLNKANDILKNGIGQITRPGGSTGFSPVKVGLFINKIQKFLTENTRLGIPALLHEECLAGPLIRGCTVFPQMIGMASTWEPDSVKDLTSIIRKQMRIFQIHQGLSPVLDVTRDPRWGRTEETFGEDPYLISCFGKAYIEGLQSKDLKSGIAATAKHFVGYGLPEGGMNWAPSHIPERELKEQFLLPFEVAVKEAKVESIMNGYHEIDGIPCGSSEELLTNILREEWGFSGTVVSDYFAIDQLMNYHHLTDNKGEAAILALKAGIDVELPFHNCYKEPLKKAVERGDISLSLINNAVKRVLESKIRLGVFSNPFVEIDKIPEILDSKKNRAVALSCAEKSLVLLKNSNDNLPIKEKIKKIAVIGPNANSERNLFGDYSFPVHIETLLSMEDDQEFENPIPKIKDLSSTTVETINILNGIKKVSESKYDILYSKGCDVLEGTEEELNKAIEIAKKADHLIVALGDKSGLTRDCTSGEARDSMTLELPDIQKKLLYALNKTGKPITTVLITGRPYALKEIFEYSDSVIEAWLPGEEGGTAVANAIFGKINPGGKLPISFPVSVGQIPVYYNHKPSGQRSHWLGDYVEGSPKPFLPFGFGLSYTKFKFDKFNMQKNISINENDFDVSLEVTNIGKMKGDEVVQLYISDIVSSVTRPIKELKGFVRISLLPGETKRVSFNVPICLLAFYNKNMDFVIEPGKFEIMVGNSSENILLNEKINVEGASIRKIGCKTRKFLSPATIS